MRTGVAGLLNGEQQDRETESKNVPRGESGGSSVSQVAVRKVSPPLCCQVSPSSDRGDPACASLSPLLPPPPASTTVVTGPAGVLPGYAALSGLCVMAAGTLAAPLPLLSFPSIPALPLPSPSCPRCPLPRPPSAETGGAPAGTSLVPEMLLGPDSGAPVSCPLPFLPRRRILNGATGSWAPRVVQEVKGPGCPKGIIFHG